MSQIVVILPTVKCSEVIAMTATSTLCRVKIFTRRKALERKCVNPLKTEQSSFNGSSAHCKAMDHVFKNVPIKWPSMERLLFLKSKSRPKSIFASLILFIIIYCAKLYHDDKDDMIIYYHEECQCYRSIKVMQSNTNATSGLTSCSKVRIWILGFYPIIIWIF